ncbi:hypothetical protein L873DRAFT_1793123 [Choiromyces venosus 120613-1]|uniref:DDE-1 domain-containing protein n=1 Tax=Choiromyces venosus 120613-1 TaxID=1336337 RepID=A0A3N4JA81_9PEZI|nr:hypothetical protein L873DRAFT_1793123 [Choiromyces venosus 120613-1]
MDESGVRIGCQIGEMINVPTEVKELYTSSPENRKSITIIETICADGSTPIPPVIICPGKKIMENWVDENLLEANVIVVSPTGYTNENIALASLDHFIKHDDFTIKNAFKDSGMFSVAFKKALKKMRYYNHKTPTNRVLEEPIGSASSSGAIESQVDASVDEGRELELPTLPSTYFNCQKDLSQALFLLEPASTRVSRVIDPQLLDNIDENIELEIYTGSLQFGEQYITQKAIDGCNSRSDSKDLACESDSDSSCISYDSIAQNADFVALD